MLVTGDMVSGRPLRLEFNELVGEGGKRRSGTDGRRGFVAMCGFAETVIGRDGSRAVTAVGVSVAPSPCVFVSRERTCFDRLSLMYGDCSKDEVLGRCGGSVC